jgi:hypothetical protein
MSELDALLRTDFASFVRKAHRFINDVALSDDRYIDAICAQVVKVVNGETRRLIINIPPGHGKTFIASICSSAWTLAHQPSAKIIIVCCSEDLATEIAYKHEQYCKPHGTVEFLPPVLRRIGQVGRTSRRQVAAVCSQPRSPAR